jgi:tRNA A37 threonylcarbamoyladenosine dehydratase
MSQNVTVSPDQPVAELTASQLEALITAVVQRVMREELRRDYYVNEHGVKVLYAVEEAAPAYLAELQQDYEAIQKGEAELVSGEQVVQELHDLGIEV